MAFAATGLRLRKQDIGGGRKEWDYRTTDSISTVTGTDYITNATDYKLSEGDVVYVVKTNDDPPSVYVCHVNAIDADDNATLARGTLAITDNSTGTASTTIAAGVGISTLSIPITLAQITGAGDVLTTFTPGYKFKLLEVSAFVTSAVTTAAKAATLNLEIGTTNVTGGEVALTSANCTPLGAKVAGSAITAANTGSSSDTVSVEAASVTAFAEGAVVLLVRIQNMDTADAVASLAVKA